MNTAQKQQLTRVFDSYDQITNMRKLMEEKRPTLLIVGERDFPMLERDAKAFAEKAKTSGAAVRTSVAKACDHMGVVRGLLEDKSPVLEDVLVFLKTQKTEGK
jgi:hypothetical protein